MAKRRAKNQIINLISNHKKSRITLKYMDVGGMPHIVGKISIKVTTFL
jgi:hypothetical protein